MYLTSQPSTNTDLYMQSPNKPSHMAYPYYLNFDIFHSILLQSTVLTALMDCDSGLEKHCTAFFLSEGQKKGNIIIRKMNDCLTRPHGNICCRPKNEYYLVDCIGNIITYKLGRHALCSQQRF